MTDSPLRNAVPFLLLLPLLLMSGCQPASRYSSTTPTTRSADSSLEVPPIPKAEHEAAAAVIWQVPDATVQAPDAPLVFVPAGSAEWHALKDYWNPEWQRPLAGLGGTPLGVAALLGGGWLTPAVRIKVPLGLEDPTPYIPAANPPTLAKWQLGKDLFFDDRVFLQAEDEVSRLACASCHNPSTGFTDTKVASRHSQLDTPTLINVVFNRRQFWDGRAELLEQVVQLTPEDEKGPQRRFHAWPGVVARLRQDATYAPRFRAVFGTPPTQDAVGKAIATYLRTILAGDAIQDRAEQAQRERNGPALTAADYEKVLDAAALETLPWRHGPKPSRGELAAELLKGYTQFHGQAGCVACHGGRNYSDGGFHNLGIGESSMLRLAGLEQGRFATAPPGDKSLYLIGAFKTPTLRALPRTSPYFHNGSRLGIDLDEVFFEIIAWHVDKAPLQRPSNPHLAPELRRRHLKEDDLTSLVVFLKALSGGPPPAVITQR